MNVEVIANEFIKNFNEDLRWIFVGGNRSITGKIKSLIPNDQHRNCCFTFPLSDLGKKYSDTEVEIRKAAANSMMFKLVFLENISVNEIDNLYRLFFYLKNLGFSGVLLAEGQNIRIKKYCNELNVGYSVLGK